LLTLGRRLNSVQLRAEICMNFRILVGFPA
jgi:hypothetical protein